MKQQRGLLSQWAIRHPIGVTMLTLALVVLGYVAFKSLNIDLLPHIIYPEVRVRVIDPGVPATIMEDQVTRQLEEQLAITEDAIHIQSRTSEGRSAVDLAFEYNKDIDIALRDASTRLDRAKRFLPDTVQPPVIYKRDPFQLPVLELMITSQQWSPVQIRDWADYSLSKLLLNLPGVAAVEIGGGVRREILIEVDQNRLASLGLELSDLRKLVKDSNIDTATGRLRTSASEISGRIQGRLPDINTLNDLPVPGTSLRLSDIATIRDGAEEERVRVRNNGNPGVKVSIQKQPGVNTVDVADAISLELKRLTDNAIIPQEIALGIVRDQSQRIRSSINTTLQAVISGAILAMLVVFLFLGDWRRTLIIGTAIPVAIMITYILMTALGLNLNIMTLGGLALGVGMLVDSTIVMLENIQRHQRMGSDAQHAVGEVAGAIFASTSTNLAAILPFLFLGGLIGLLFQELLFTISSAVVAAMIVALTLVPALGAKLKGNQKSHSADKFALHVARHYGDFLHRILTMSGRGRLIIIALFVIILVPTAQSLFSLPSSLLPDMDEGSVRISLTADDGTDIESMDVLAQRVETVVETMPAVESVFTTVGGFIFGRSQFERTNRTSIQVLLTPARTRDLSTNDWVNTFKTRIAEEKIAGLRINAQPQKVRGIRTNSGEDDLSLRIRGPELVELTSVADNIVEKLQNIEGLGNVRHSNEDIKRELIVSINRERAAQFGLDTATIGDAVKTAIDGSLVTQLIQDDRTIDVRLRLENEQRRGVTALENVRLKPGGIDSSELRLSDVASITINPAPSDILREKQQRVVEVNAAFTNPQNMKNILQEALGSARNIELPVGYSIEEAGSLKALQEGRSLGFMLFALAIFLVLVAMAVQYESLRDPFVILLGIPFALIGVAIGLFVTNTPTSMPVWIGMIMLAGIVVNNAIVLVEMIEIQRHKGMMVIAATVEAARLRIKPILMTTLTTVAGMLPLSISSGEGVEMLQPLAVVIVSGLLFSTLVSLVLIPVFYVALTKETPAI